MAAAVLHPPPELIYTPEPSSFWIPLLHSSLLNISSAPAAESDATEDADKYAIVEGDGQRRAGRELCR
jgi:hypothetical protein